MLSLLFASNNRHKIEEVQELFGSSFDIISLKEAGFDIDIPEPYDTLEDNARQKARVVYDLAGRDCFSEDTGLEIEALNGAPGVRSARYAGDEKSFERNIAKVLDELGGQKDRSARFRAVICLILNGREFMFEGITNGEIKSTPKGARGFGYDPIFVPNGETRTFAEMTMQEKSVYSHRARAMKQMVAFLQNIYTKA